MQTKSMTILIGRIGKDPESKELNEGKSTVTEFTLATEETWKDKKGEKQKRTEWHNIQLWGNKNLIKYLKKGAPICVQGKNKTESYEKTYGGQKVTHYITKVVADEITLLDSNKSDKETMTGE